MSAHVPVLADELVAGIAPSAGATLVDCTFGGGGHTGRLLAAVGEHGKVIAFDRDANAIERGKTKFQAACARGQLKLIHSEFSAISSVLALFNIARVDGIVADIGFSSDQISDPSRGFGFQNAGPLDMRMNPTHQTLTAAHVLQTYSERELADLFWRYGEERRSRKFAAAIIDRRSSEPFIDTRDLAEFAAKILGKRKNKIHPATLIFQALRIEVNQELKELETLVNEAPKLLNPGGRFGVISFHSLEDRIVKRAFKNLSSPASDLPRELPLREEPSKYEIIKPFPFKPTQEEIERNPRSRSARLRFLGKKELQ